MKELSIEEKAKRYDEAIERAKFYKEFYKENTDMVSTKDVSDVIEDIFSELKESEDNRIKNFISNELACLRATDEKGTVRYEELTEAIAWLEKQGESKFEQCIQDGDKIVTNEDGTHFNVSQLERVAKKEPNPAWSDYDRDMLDNLIEDEYSPLGAEYISWFKDIKERFGNIEKKPSNKVEPKFKVGDCIVRNGLGTYKIVEVCKSWYEVISYKDGLQYSIGFDDEKNCHLWSKEDIKRGDVIQLGEVTAIFNEHIGNEKCTCYCSIFNGEFEIPINYDDSIYGFYYCSPATKEQRDLLFKKMKEAGFKWYSKKKMLK